LIKESAYLKSVTVRNIFFEKDKKDQN